MSVEALTTLQNVHERDDLPSLQTGITTAAAESTADTDATSLDGAPTISTESDGELPSLASSSDALPVLPSLSTSSATYTSVSMVVPSSRDNPFISSTTKPRGTVFIGLGSAAAFVLLLFGLYHLIKSLLASTVAKKTVNNEKRAYQKFADNAIYRENNRSSTIFENLTAQTSKMPSFGKGPSSFSVAQNDNSYYELMVPTTHEDLTNMFISPTREVMAGKSRSLVDSHVNVSTLGYGKSGLNTAGSRSSQHVPSMYFYETPSNSTIAVPIRTPEKPKRRAVPSMYLEDLLDDATYPQRGNHQLPSF